MAASLMLLSAVFCCSAFFEFFRKSGASLARNPGLYLALFSILMAYLARNGAFLNATALPPRLMLAVVPVIAIMIWQGVKNDPTKTLRHDIAFLALISTVRIPVEIALHQLAAEGLVPWAITWSGTNFDIFSGMTAPFVAWLTAKGHLPKTGVLVWNLLCLGLLLNVVTTAVLSAPFPFQALNFDQPNRAVLHYPYALLPIAIVPVVLFTHIRSLKLACSATNAY